jgi:hypothetical protein
MHPNAGRSGLILSGQEFTGPVTLPWIDPAIACTAAHQRFVDLSTLISRSGAVAGTAIPPLIALSTRSFKSCE